MARLVITVMMMAHGLARAADLPDHAIAATGAFACARTQDGHVACWGQAPDGAHAVPAIIPGLADVAGLAVTDAGMVATSSRAVAWTTTGVAWQWDGQHLARLPINDVVELAASTDATCARRTHGISCWIDNGSPVEVLVAGAEQIAVADHVACARAGGDVSCWTIGADPPKPAVVARAHGARWLAGSSRGTRGSAFAVVLPRGRVASWSYAWTSSTTGGALAGLPVPALPADITAIAIGDMETCALGEHVTCWADDAKPIVRSIDPIGAVAIAVGSSLGCAAMQDRSVRCWGHAGYVGDGTSAIASTPVEVTGITDAVQLGANRDGGCVRRANGHVACWGARFVEWSARTQQIDLVPQEVPDLADATELFVGLREACVRRKTGRYACWGFDGKTTHVRPTDRPELASASWVGVLELGVCGLHGRHLQCGADAVTEFKPVPAHTTAVWQGSWFRGQYLCARARGAITCQSRWVAHGEADLDTVTFAAIDGTDIVAVHMPSNQEVDQLCTADRAGDVRCNTMVESGATTIAVEGVAAFAEGPVFPFGNGAATCAVTKNATVACWSSGGALWTIPGITDAVEVAGGSSVACAREKTGHVACWGDADFVGNSARSTRDSTALVRGLAL